MNDSTELSNLGLVSEMLDETKFWDIVALSLQHSEDQDEQEAFLIEELQKLSLKEIVGFRLRTDKLLYDTYFSKMWCAAYIINGGCSDDGFEYFRNWLISLGKDTYYLAKANPDDLAAIITEEDLEPYDSGEFEGFWYVALHAFEQKCGAQLYDYIDYDNFKTREGSYPSMEFDWEEEDEESMKKLCPKLFDEFW